MHAGRVLSLKRKHSLERSRSRSRLQRGQANGDLFRSIDDPEVDPNAPWYLSKWDERRRAFQSAKSTRGLSLFHMFALVALIGVGLMVGSLFVGPAAGLLEIGFSALLFSLFCLIFVRCDAGDEGDDPGGKCAGQIDPLTSLVIEEKVVGEGQAVSAPDSDDQTSSLLTRSVPRKIPSPLRVFGYEMNFSPILECSEPGSSVSSFLTRNSSVPSRLANSSTGDSLSRVSSRGSGVSGSGMGGPGSGPPGPGSPINEELEDFDYDQQLQLKLDFMGPQDSFQKFQSYDSFESDGGDRDLDPDADRDHDLLSLSNSNLSTYSASFDTDDSITADLSVVTVVERNPSGSGNGSSPNPSKESTSPSP